MSREEANASLVARLWAPPTPSRRGPRPTLSVERIVEAAVELADAEGLEAVSMARIGKALGVTAMALYRHISGKDELVARLADAVTADLPAIPTDQGWRVGLEHWMRAQIDLATERPWFVGLPLSTVLPGPHRLKWIDQAFGVMSELPLAADEKLAIIGMLAEHVLGEARIQVESRAAGENPYADFEALLTEFAEPAEYPHLMGALASWQPTDQDRGKDGSTDDDVGFRLQIVLDGVEAYVGRRAASR